MKRGPKPADQSIGQSAETITQETEIAPPVPPEAPSRLKEIQGEIDRLSQSARGTKAEALNGFLDIFKNKELLPENGVIHVLGSGENHYEWLLPLLSREDVRVFVSDPHFEYWLEHDTRHLSEGTLKKFWDELIRDHPEVRAASPHLATFEAFKGLVNSRVQFYRFAERVPVPADLTLARYPLSAVGWDAGNNDRHLFQTELANRIEKTVKPGGIAWVFSEMDLPGYFTQAVDSVRIDGPYQQISAPGVSVRRSYGHPGIGHLIRIKH